MPRLGAHMSIGGGLHKAIEAAADLQMETVQIFTASPSQWSVKPNPDLQIDPAALLDADLFQHRAWLGKPLAADEIRQFQDTLAERGLQTPVAHDSYLINLASPDPTLWRRSIDAFTLELEKAHELDLIGVVTHPGSYVDSTEQAGLDRIVAGLEIVHRRTAGIRPLTLLETTAGQGTNLGNRFEHLAYLIEQSPDSGRIGVCVDTCHIFAAGYPLGSQAEYVATMAELDRIVGLNRVRAFHLNDSVKGLSSRVDRHAGIGRGCIGLEAFRLLMNDERLAGIPMYMETPKGDENGEPLDAINLRQLRGLVGRMEPFVPENPERKLILPLDFDAETDAETDAEEQASASSGARSGTGKPKSPGRKKVAADKSKKSADAVKSETAAIVADVKKIRGSSQATTKTATAKKATLKDAAAPKSVRKARSPQAEESPRRKKS